jgi:HEAT repeat protein
MIRPVFRLLRSACLLLSLGIPGRARPLFPQEGIPANIPPKVRAEIEKLYSDRPVERGYGAYHLGKMGRGALVSVPYLMAMLADGPRNLRWTGGEPTSPGDEALGALGKIDPGWKRSRTGRNTIERIRGILGDRDAKGRVEAAWILGIIEDRDSIPVLVAALEDGEYSVRSAAMTALEQINDIDSLLIALKSKYALLRISAAASLIGSADPRILEPMIAALEDTDLSVRAEAKMCLSMAKETGPLQAALRSGSPAIRRDVAQILGQIKDPDAIEPLAAALQDPDREIRGACVMALAEIDDPRTVEPLILALGDKDPLIRHDAILGLGRKRDPRASDALISVLKRGDSNQRRDAALAFGKSKEPAGVDALIGALDDPNSDTCIFAVWALGEIGDTRAMQPLVKKLHYFDPDVVQAVEQALGKLQKGSGTIPASPVKQK